MTGPLEELRESAAYVRMSAAQRRQNIADAVYPVPDRLKGRMLALCEQEEAEAAGIEAEIARRESQP